MPINSFLYPGAKVEPAFTVANSLRTNRGSSDYLSRTNGSAGNRRTFTISYWMKIATSSSAYIFGTATSGTNIIDHYSSNTGAITMEAYTGSYTVRLTSDPILRDQSAWYHICYAIDTTQSTEANRVKLYINGSQTTFNSSPYKVFPSQNLELPYNQNGAGVTINCQSNYNAEFFGAYYCEFCMIDGSALAPTEFGEFDSDSPTIWKPKDVSGLTFGTNGFHLNFENASSLGADVSGNGNNFTVNNLTSIDQSTDTCTNNYAVLNPLLPHDTAQFSEGNLKITQSSTDGDGIRATIGVRKGKWYWEVLNGGGNASPGIATGSATTTEYIGSDANGFSYFINGNKYTGGSASGYGASFTTGDIIGHALDMDNNQITFYKNGSSQGVAFTSLPDEFIFPAISTSNVSSVTSTSNFGQDGSFAGAKTAQGNSDANGYGNFYYSVPSGYYAINSKNLAEFG